MNPTNNNDRCTREVWHNFQSYRCRNKAKENGLCGVHAPKKPVVDTSKPYTFTPAPAKVTIDQTFTLTDGPTLPKRYSSQTSIIVRTVRVTMTRNGSDLIVEKVTIHGPAAKKDGSPSATELTDGLLVGPNDIDSIPEVLAPIITAAKDNAANL